MTDGTGGQIRLDQFNLVTHKVRLGDTSATEYVWEDTEHNAVAEFKVWDWWDGVNISNILVHDPYKRKGILYQILQYAVRECGVKNLAVKKNNYIALHAYRKFGFIVVDSDDKLYYMSFIPRFPYNLIPGLTEPQTQKISEKSKRAY